MKTCAYIFLAVILGGIVWAQKDADLFDENFDDAPLAVQSGKTFETSKSKNKKADLDSYSRAESDFAPSDAESKIALIEKQITILTNCYNKMRSALQSVARKMPSQTATNVAAIALEDNKEILVVLNTLSDRMKQLERNVAKGSSQSTSGTRDDSKEVLMALDSLTKHMAALENTVEKLSAQGGSASAPREGNKEMLMVLDTMSDRIMKLEGTLANVSSQVDGVNRQVADMKTAVPAGTSAAPVNDSEAALLGKEILIVVKAMSQKLDKMADATPASTGTVSTQGVEDKISSLESSIRQLSLQVTSLASQKSGGVSTASSQQPVVEKISSLENAIELLSRQVTDLASQKPQVSSGASNASVMNQEAMILFKTMSEKLDKIETSLATGAVAGAPAVSEDMLVSIVGAVVSPGKIKVDGTGKKDLLTAISEVGGFIPTADRTAVTVRRGPKVFTIDVERIMNENLLSFMLEGKDIVVVKEREGKKSIGSPSQTMTPSQAIPPASPSALIEPRIESVPAKESSSNFTMKPKLGPQTGDILPRGEDGRDSVLQKEVTALRFE